MNAQLGTLLLPARSESVTQKWNTPFVLLGACQTSSYTAPCWTPKKPWVMCATAVLFLHTAIDAATSPLSSVALNARLVLVPHIPKAGNATTVGAVTSVGHDGGP